MSEPTRIPEMRRRRFARLPRELQLIILRYVFEPDANTYLTYLSSSPGVHYFEPGPIGSVREWLKPIRLISRLFHDAVTPFIFASIHLHASELSLQRAESISNSPLAGHVREIVHYEGTFAGAVQDKKQFFSILASHRRRRDYPKDYDFSPTEELYENYLQEIAAGGEQNIFRVDRMTALLQKLPRCITFTTLRYGTEWADPLTSAYTLRRTGLSYLPRPTEPTNLNRPSFVSSMAKWSPRLLNLTNFPYASLHTLLKLLPDSHLDSVHNWAGRLTRLKLGWPDHSRYFATQSHPISDDMRLLTNLFRNCHELVHLELVHAFELSPDAPFFPEHGLPKLECLTLTGTNMVNSWAEETLFNWIKQLGSTLKHLHFQNTSLERYVDGSNRNGSDGSLLRLLFNLTSCTNLESCTGLDTVKDIKSNVLMKQAFVVPGPKPEKSVILHKVQEAVCGRRPWPEGFSMDHLPMDVTASNLQETVITDEAAFIFSSWRDTVDPWDVDIVPDDLVKDSDLEVVNFEKLFGQCNLEDQRAEQTVTMTPTVLGTRTKRSRLSRMLGLKQRRG